MERKYTDMVSRINLDCIQVMLAKYGKCAPITFEYSNKLTHTAGKAYYKEHRIVLSIPLFTQNFEDFEQVIYHEIAHVYAVLIYGEQGRGHGYHWKEVMRALGRTPDRCHSYATPKRKRKSTTIYTLTPCCTSYTVGPRIAKSMYKRLQILGYSHRVCNSCKGRVSLTDEAKELCKAKGW